MKWYVKLLVAVLVIVFSPLILLLLLFVALLYLAQLPGSLKAYKNSAYYQEFGLPFMLSRLYCPEYRFFNSFKKRELPVTYIRQESNGLEYFIYDGTLYLFPDFDHMFFEENARWEADFDGDWEDFEKAWAERLSQLDTDPGLPIKLLVERKMFTAYDLRETPLPACIFLTANYETAFENEDSPFKLTVPTDPQQLYDRMAATPGLCGAFRMAENGQIHWDLYPGFRIDIDVAPEDCYVRVNRLLPGGTARELTHWHPTVYEIYDEVCKLGMPGNVLVFRTFGIGESVLYMGSEADCPYTPDQKPLLGKWYYLKAE